MTDLVRADPPSGADTVDRLVCRLRPLRIHGRMFLRRLDTAMPLHVAGETSSEHGANSSPRLCRMVRLACQKPFVTEPSAMEEAADAAWELVWTETAAACIATSREARSAASIVSRTLRARRVRFTKGRSTLTPVVRTRDPAVGPSASSSITHARPMPVKIAP